MPGTILKEIEYGLYKKRIVVLFTIMFYLLQDDRILEVALPLDAGSHDSPTSLSMPGFSLLTTAHAQVSEIGLCSPTFPL